MYTGGSGSKTALLKSALKTVMDPPPPGGLKGTRGVLDTTGISHSDPWMSP